MAVKVGQVLIDVKADTTKLVKGMTNAQKSVKRTVDNMKRTLVAFASANLFKNLISDGLKYNSALETTQQSITGLLVATSKLEDAQGKAITTQELYNIATKESASILEDLKRINAETPVGLNDTARIYKTILPSMRAVGAEHKDLITLTKNLAVATTVGAGNMSQLLAGIDGLATGTVLANSELGRFLQGLGLTNDVLKKSDDLVGLLNERLGKLKGEITMETQLSNLSEAWTSTLGEMTKGLWEASKEWIQALIDYLNRFKEGVKLLPVFFKAMALAINDIWKLTIAYLKLQWEEFVDTIKTLFNYLTSLNTIELSINADLEGARNNFNDIKNSMKSGKEHLYDLLNALPATAEVSGTVAKNMTTVATETDKAKASTEKLAKSVKEVKTDYQNLEEDGINRLSDGMTSMFRDWQDGALDWRDTMRNVLNDILAQMFQMLVVKQLISSVGGSFGGGFDSVLGQFAQGGAFQNGVQKFASGGVVTQPTLFPMANGAGLMGEAGAEAIMPLTRMSNGNLGVEAEAMATVVNVNNFGNDEVSVQQNGNEIDIIISQIAQGIQRGTSEVGNAIESRYAISKQ